MNYKTFFNFLLFIILFYYLCYHCNNNYEKFFICESYEYCEYCGKGMCINKLNKHLDTCIAKYKYTHQISKNYGGDGGGNFIIACNSPNTNRSRKKK